MGDIRCGALVSCSVSVWPVPRRGTITGQVTHATEHIAVQDAVVWAEPVGAMPTFPLPAQPVEMAQVHLAFIPRMLPVLVGTTVEFPNRNTVYHSVFSFTRQQRFEIGLYPLGESRAGHRRRHLPGRRNRVAGQTGLPASEAGQAPCVDPVLSIGYQRQRKGT
jgi:plastocyanin